MAVQENSAKQPTFAVQRVYLKDISFESPNAPTVFKSEWKPKVKMDLNTENKKLSDNQWEVTLTITVTANIEEKPAFIIEIQQAGIFLVDGLNQQQTAHTLGAFCPNLLFPYARETVDSMVVKGSFPALMLQPVNFDAIYAEALKRQKDKATEESAEAAKH